MSDIRRVYVWIRLPGGKSCPLGEIATQMDEEGGRIQGQFRYADDWLDHPDGFNIDPANLAWVSGPQDAGRPARVSIPFLRMRYPMIGDNK